MHIYVFVNEKNCADQSRCGVNDYIIKTVPRETTVMSFLKLAFQCRLTLAHSRVRMGQKFLNHEYDNKKRKNNFFSYGLIFCSTGLFLPLL